MQSSFETLDNDASGDLLGFKAVKAAIDRLFTLAMTIRHEARLNHTMRHGTNTQQEALMYCLLIKARYPNIRNSLCNQLGTSIYIRGQSLLYLKAHNQKLAFKRHDQNRVQDAADKGPILENSDNGSYHCIDSQAVDRQPLALTPGTPLSVLDNSVVSRIAKGNDPPESSVDRGWAIWDGQEDNFYYPPKPEKTNDERYLTCNLCANLLEESGLTQEAWEYAINFSFPCKNCED
jgi:hypothetical protein